MKKLKAKVNVLHLGDCREVLKSGLVESESISVIHTSPPYNIGKNYHSYKDKEEIEEYLSFVDEVVSLCSKALKPGGSFFWQTGYTQNNGKNQEFVPIDVLTYPLFLKNNFYLKDRIIWNYFGSMSFKSKFTNRHETIMWYVKKDSKGSNTATYLNVDEVREKSREKDPRNNLLGRNPGNVWAVDRVAYGSSEQTSHIAVFPEEICERIIRACSKKGDVVMDPFCGSGTFIKVAKSLDRNWIGIELSPLYYKETNKRVNFQQPGEVRTVVSQIIKDYMVQGHKELKTSDLVEMLKVFFSGNLHSQYKAFLREKVKELSVDKDGKKKKKEIWETFEKYFAQKSNELMVHIGDAYVRNYKLAKHFNEYRLFLIGLDILNQIELITKGNKIKLKNFVKNILIEESESFKVSGEKVVLKSYQRRIRFSKKTSKSSKGERLLFDL